MLTYIPVQRRTPASTSTTTRVTNSAQEGRAGILRVLSRSKAKRTAPSEPVDAFEVRQWERDELGQLVHFDVTV